jgi:hypothetical protein
LSIGADCLRRRAYLGRVARWTPWVSCTPGSTGACAGSSSRMPCSDTGASAAPHVPLASWLPHFHAVARSLSHDIGPSGPGGRGALKDGRWPHHDRMSTAPTSASTLAFRDAARRRRRLLETLDKQLGWHAVPVRPLRGLADRAVRTPTRKITCTCHAAILPQPTRHTLPDRHGTPSSSTSWWDHHPTTLSSRKASRARGVRAMGAGRPKTAGQRHARRGCPC